MIVNTPKAVPNGIWKQSNPATTIENMRCLLCNRKTADSRLRTEASTKMAAKNAYIQMNASRNALGGGVAFPWFFHISGFEKNVCMKK